MKTVLMGVGILALLPFALPAILVSMLTVGLLLHAIAPLAPVIWAAVILAVVLRYKGRVWNSPLQRTSSPSSPSSSSPTSSLS